MIEIRCSFCHKPVRRPNGQPFVCDTCEQMQADGLIRRVTIPPSMYTDWKNYPNPYRPTRLFPLSDRILGASS